MAAQDELYAGIDLGGTNMTIGIVDGGGALRGRAKRKTKAKLGRDGVIERIAEGVDRACADAGVPRSALAGAGIGAPGAVDGPRGVVIASGNLGWSEVGLRDLLATALGVPVALDNDVNVAAYGEITLGVARKRRNALAVWVGTGVGGGLVFDRRIFQGDFCTAGEIGYTVVVPGGGPAGSRLEDHCSRTAMTAAIRRLLPSRPASRFHDLLRDHEPDDPVGSGTIAEAYAAEDELAQEVVHHAADTLGVAIANWITVLSIDTVILGGGVTEALGDPFVARVRRSFDRCVFPSVCRSCSLLVSELGDLAGVYGSAMLARDALAAGRAKGSPS
jgi:glucokinase